MERDVRKKVFRCWFVRNWLDILYFRKEKFSYSEKDFDSVSVNILENIYKANKDQVSSKVIC